MRQGIILTALGLLLLGTAALRNSGWLLFSWTGLNFIALGTAHLLGSARLYGKRQDGSLAWWSWPLFLPLHVLTHVVWHLGRNLFRGGKADRITDDLTVGRRLLAGEIESGFTNYVDLTAEFRAPARARAFPNYLSFPILDAGVPTTSDLRVSLRRLRPGRTYVHCAQGRGRSGLFAVAMLLNSNAAASVPEALKILKAARPGIHLNRAQMRTAEQFAAELETV